MFKNNIKSKPQKDILMPAKKTQASQGIVNTLCPSSGAVKNMVPKWPSQAPQMNANTGQSSMSSGTSMSNSLLGKGNPLCSLIGDPVNASTGNFVYERTDITIGGNIPLQFHRFYNSLDTTDHLLGMGWSHNFSIYLLLKEQGVASVVFDDGRSEDYYEDDAPMDGDDSQGDRKEYQPVDGKKLTYIETEGYNLSYPNGTRFFFNMAGKMTLQKDPFGNEIELSYAEDQLVKVVSACGQLHFFYENNHVSSVCDHSGREIKFEYQNDQENKTMLSAYVDPLGNRYEYQYDKLNRLLSITNPERHIEIVNEFDWKNRVVKQTFLDGGELRYIYYQNNKTTELIQQSGSKIIYKRDDKSRTTGIVYSDGEEKIEYNDKNQKTKTIDKLGYETKYSYDSDGNICEVINALGVKMEMRYQSQQRLSSLSINGNEKFINFYDENGNIITTKDALNQKINYSYIKNGLVNNITNPDGSQVHFSYDERNNITQIIDATGVTTKYQYDLLNRVIATVDGNGHETHYQYDEGDNIIEVKNASGARRTYTYNKKNNLTSITDFDGSIIKREYNALNMLSKSVDQLNRETQFDYDLMWNVSRITEPNGGQTSFCYNELDQLETIRKPDGTTTQYQYNANGILTGMTDEEGFQTRFIYDAIGQLMEVNGEEGMRVSYTYNPEGQVVSVTNAQEQIVHLHYDANGQLIEEINVSGESRSYTYTPLGKIQSITDEIGRKTRYEYGLGGQLSTIHYPDNTLENYTYDKNGNVKTFINRLGNRTEYTYDCLDRVRQIKGNQGEIKEYTYDAVGNIVSMTNALGNKTSYEYTLTGKLAKVIDALGNELIYTYDTQDQLIEICQCNDIEQGKTTSTDLDTDLQRAREINKNNASMHITKYTRDVIGNITSVTDALNLSEQYSYDGKGQLISKVDKEGYLTKYSYTALGDVASIQYEDGHSVKLSYNSLRQLEEMEDWLGITKIAYDTLGRVAQVTDPNGRKVSYTWGKSGERESITYPDGKQVHYYYDHLLRLTEVQDGEMQVGYTYNNIGELIEKSFQNDIKTNYQYDGVGRLSGFTHRVQEEILDSYAFSYDLEGNKTSIVKNRAELSEESGTYIYCYDALNRLNEVVKDGILLRSYEYDEYGNRSKLVESEKQISYTYNALNQLLVAADSNGDTQTYNYDRRGNLTKTHKNDNLTHRYHFGAMNRLVKVFNHEKAVGATYHYNGLGHRVGKTEGTSAELVLPTAKLEQLHLNPINQVDDVVDMTKRYHNLLERNDNGNITSYIWDFNLLSSKQDDYVSHYLQDDLGSPMRLLNDVGLEEKVFGFDEFGNALYDNYGSDSFTYTGYQFDGITDTYFAQAREYNPQVGRFISQDIHWNPDNMIYGDYLLPIEGQVLLPSMLSITSSQNLYTYVMNNPNAYIDLDGEIPVPLITAGIGGLVGGLIGGVGNFAGQMIKNRGDITKTDLSDLLVSTGAGAASGALAGSGAGIIPMIAGNAAINMGSYAATQKLNGEEIKPSGLAFNGILGGVMGGLGGSNKEAVKAISSYKDAATNGMFQSGREFNNMMFKETLAKEFIGKEAIKSGLRDERNSFIAGEIFDNFSPIKNVSEKFDNLFKKKEETPVGGKQGSLTPKMPLLPKPIIPALPTSDKSAASISKMPIYPPVKKQACPTR